MRTSLLATLCFCLGLATLVAQEKPAPLKEVPTAIVKDWSGVWKGTVRNHVDVARSSTFEMQLTVEPVDANSLRWQIVYDGEAGQSVRDYQLLVDDAAQGKYTLDEKNGILLPARLLGQTLTFHFSVQDQHLWTSYKFVAGDTPQIEFDLVSSSAESVTRSGGKDEIPEVTGYSITSRQHATLVRTSNPAKPDSNALQTHPLTQWVKLETEAYRGKQDDLFMVNAKIGWYVNGAGKIYKTTDGGEHWTKQLEQPGTYFRCLAFVDEQHGFAGNIGPDYFPGVTDKTPLYETKDGGATWTPVKVDGVVGLCSLQVLREKIINAGNLEERMRLIGVGRVGGPSTMIVSDDLGKTWQTVAVDPSAAMLLDVHFFSRNEGFLAAASNADVSQSNALILSTQDGGKTWKQVWRSPRPFELTWKMSFPNRDVGYVTIQSYNPDPAASQRFVAKTTDGGVTWNELPVVDDAKVREFGIAFLNEKTGWIGAVPHGFFTKDGGLSWVKADLGAASNKIRLVPDGESTVGFAIGTNVYRIKIPRDAG
jgi:photosystem II stability/assembly factor-like uncharacterized protein